MKFSGRFKSRLEANDRWLCVPALNLPHARAECSATVGLATAILTTRNSAVCAVARGICADRHDPPVTIRDGLTPPVIRQKPREQTCTNAHDPDRESLNLLDFSGRVLRS